MKGHPLGFRTQRAVETRHAQIVAMRGGGLRVKNIGRVLGIDHSTVCHHLNGQCKCGLPSYNGRQPPRWAATLFTLDKYGPIKAAALAALVHLRPMTVYRHLREMSLAGWAEYRDGLWWLVRR